MGPVFVHTNSQSDTYSYFFNKLSMKVRDSDDLVIGTDDEKAIRKAVKSHFPKSINIVCSSHLKRNILDKLTNVGMPISGRRWVISLIFGESGLMKAKDLLELEHRSFVLINYVEQHGNKDISHYFKSRIIPIIKNGIFRVKKSALIPSLWTNNNNESVNHVLKQLVDWKTTSLLRLAKLVTQHIKAQYMDVQRSLFGSGNYRIKEEYSKFYIERDDYFALSKVDRDNHFLKFLRYSPKTNESTVVSFDGRLVVRQCRATSGKKTNQRKRPGSQRTRSIKMKKY